MFGIYVGARTSLIVSPLMIFTPSVVKSISDKREPEATDIAGFLTLSIICKISLSIVLRYFTSARIKRPIESG